MDAPQIEYTTTEDGVAIAYWSLGEGPALVHAQNFVLSHIELEWRCPELRAWYERLAQHYRVVRFCWRGTGLSGDAPISTLAEPVADLAAVIHAVGSESVTLLGIHGSGPAVIAFAAQQSEPLKRLVLFNAVTNFVESPSGG